MNTVLTERDIKARQFVFSFGLASLSHLASAVFGGGKSSDRVARRRMRILAEHHLVSRYKKECTGEYIYFIGRRPPVQEDHHLQITTVYVALLKLGGQIEVWQREPDWGALRPDAYCIYWFNGHKYHFAVEVQRPGNPFDQVKYERYLIAQEQFKVFPRVLVVSEKPMRISSSSIRYVVISPDMAGLENIVK